MDERSEKNLKGVHPDLAKVMRAANATSPIPFIIIWGVRLTEEQQKLYAKGRTEAGKIVTQCDGVIKKSEHQIKEDGYGHAVDVCPDTNKNGKVDTPEISDVASLKIIGEHIVETGKSMGITIIWGANFKIKDYPHFQN